MRTYNFCYTPDDNDGFGHVQFCGETEEEARNCFDNYCRDELKGFKPTSVEVEQVYNAADHIAYGSKYEW